MKVSNNDSETIIDERKGFVKFLLQLITTIAISALLICLK